jgi:hypothetical protein
VTTLHHWHEPEGARGCRIGELNPAPGCFVDPECTGGSLLSCGYSMPSRTAYELEEHPRTA